MFDAPHLGAPVLARSIRATGNMILSEQKYPGLLHKISFEFCSIYQPAPLPPRAPAAAAAWAQQRRRNPTFITALIIKSN